MLVKNTDEILQLQKRFQNNSVLKFTYELNTTNKIPFLEILMNTNNNKFTISPYKKTYQHKFMYT